MIRWLALLVVSLAFNVLAILLTPVLVLFGRPEWGLIDNGNAQSIEPRLPGWLAWFATWDNSLWGDNGHKERWGNACSYGQMVAWLWRNPAYGFERAVLGARITPSSRVWTDGNPWIKNRSAGLEGHLVVWVDDYWCWKRIIDTGDGHCWMLEFGWKLQPYAQNPRLTASLPTAQFVFSLRYTEFNPL